MNPPEPDVRPPETEWDEQPIPTDRWDRARAMARRTPGWAFDLVLVLPLVGLLYSRSFPGSAYRVTIASGLALVVLAIVWIVRTVAYFTARRAGRAEGRPAALVVAPIMTAVVLILFALAIPLRVRWAMSKGDFETWSKKALAVPLSTSLPPSFATTHHIGAYDITQIDRGDRIVVFREKQGEFLGSAGFAYLPDGPTAKVRAIFNQPHFRHLGGVWYSWTAK